MQLGVEQEGFDGCSGLEAGSPGTSERCMSGEGSGVQKQDRYEYRE